MSNNHFQLLMEKFESLEQKVDKNHADTMRLHITRRTVMNDQEFQNQVDLFFVHLGELNSLYVAWMMLAKQSSNKPIPTRVFELLEELTNLGEILTEFQKNP